MVCKPSTRDIRCIASTIARLPLSVLASRTNWPSNLPLSTGRRRKYAHDDMTLQKSVSPNRHPSESEREMDELYAQKHVIVTPYNLSHQRHIENAKARITPS